MLSQHFAKYVIPSLLLAAFLNLSTSALTMPRRSITREGDIATRADDSDKTLENLTQDALERYLHSQNVEDFAFSRGWTTVDFAGVNDQSGPAANNQLFETVDPVASSIGQVHFSDKFREFISTVNEHIPHSAEDSSEMNKAREDQDNYCNGELLGNALLKAVQDYTNSTLKQLTTGIDDPDFQSWLNTNAIDYRDVQTKCDAAKDKYFAEADKFRGVD